MSSEKGVDLAVEVIKQQITIATAIIGGVFAFYELIMRDPSTASRIMLLLMLALLVSSVGVGILGLMSLADALRRDGDPLAGRLVRVCGMTQNITFLTAVLLMALLAIGRIV